jgi:hypothetical protein
MSGFPNRSFTNTSTLIHTQITPTSFNKSNLFLDQTPSSRVAKLKSQALQAEKHAYAKTGYPVKNETERNSRIDALTRVRAGGYVVPPKPQHQSHKA